MQQRTLELPHVTLHAMTWGDIDSDAPLAVLLHGYPDSPHTWRHLGPALAVEGWRVVAPWTRGYAPSSIPEDGCFAIGALASDAVAVHAALGGGTDSVLIGHDWGAITANAVGAHPDSPYAAAVTMAVPPLSAIALRPATVLRQARRSWYIAYHQVRGFSERSQPTLIEKLWRDWSPGYDGAEDVAHARDAIIGREKAALGYYRALASPRRPPVRYRSWHRTWREIPTVPTLHLHGRDDGCLGVELIDGLDQVLPAGSEVRIVDEAGHFLQLEQPEIVNAAVLEFLRRTQP